MEKARTKASSARTRLFIFFPAYVAVHHHGQNRAFRLLFLPALFGPCRLCSWPSSNVGQRGVLKDAGRGIAHIEEYLVEPAVLSIVVNQAAQLLGVAKRGERTVNQADDFAEMNFRGWTPQLVPALGSADA